MGHQRADRMRGADADWRMSAVCRDMDPDVFFPDHGDRKAVERAVAVCRGCPVSGECDAFARSHPRILGYPLDGVWAGRPRWRDMP